MPADVRDEMLTLLASGMRGTGRAAALSVEAFGKTGTSQSGRDAWFIGFAGDLVVGVWVGNDDNTPNPGLHGGGIPAQLWRNFMVSALDLAPVVKASAVPENEIDPETMLPPEAMDAIEGARDQLEGLNLRLGEDGSLQLDRREERDPTPPPPDDNEGAEPQ